MKLALIMQYSVHDEPQMARLCRLIAAMEPAFNKDVDFVFSIKHGAPTNNQAMALISEKFNVIVFRGNRRDVGWPDGPSAQWCETMDWAYRETRPMYYGVAAGKRAWDYVLTTEPDIVPLCRDWLAKLMAFVESAAVPVVGVDHGDHINGNAFFKPDYAALNKMHGAPSGQAWDMYWAKQNLENSVDCPLMNNIYNAADREGCNEEMLYSERIPGITPVFVHGIKGNQAQDIIAKKFGIDLDKSLTSVRS